MVERGFRALKVVWLLALLFVVKPSLAQLDSTAFDGMQRTYLVHLPTGYTGTTNLPLLVAMHGGFGSALNLQNQSQLSVKADQENFIVVYPEGVRGGLLNISSWNAGACCGFASNTNVDDVGFIDALLDTLIQALAIDTNRVYATGMSNGGFMAYRLACELSDRFAAIAPVAASISVSSCTLIRQVPLISFHSYLDESIPHAGGVGNGFSNHYNPPQDSVHQAWASANGCQIVNDTIVSNGQYDEIHWSNCNCAATVQRIITEDGGHSWPGGNATLLGDPVSNFINANDRMWDFFQQHTLACVSTSTNELQQQARIQVYPNPTRDKVQISVGRPFQSIQLQVFDLQGKRWLNVQQQTSLDLGSLPAGVYSLTIEVDNQKEHHRLVKYY